MSEPILPQSINPLSPMELGYAPPAKKSSRSVWVVVMGLLTTAAALAGVYGLQARDNVNIMGWYADYIVPVGAILVGVAASSGYAFMSWRLGVKIRRGLLVTILVLLFTAYFAAEYVAFKSRGPLVLPGKMAMVRGPHRPMKVTHYRRLGFWEYFHLKAVNWTWKKEIPSQKENQPLGKAGYIFVGLGIIGFAFSGLIIPAALSRSPYCELCERYMRRRAICVLPAQVRMKMPRKKDTAARAEQDKIQTAKYQEAVDRLDRLVATARNNDSAAFLRESAQDPKEMKAAKKLSRRLRVGLVECVSCSSGYLAPVWLLGKGKKLKRQKLPHVELGPDFVKAIRR